MMVRVSGKTRCSTTLPAVCKYVFTEPGAKNSHWLLIVVEKLLATTEGSYPAGLAPQVALAFEPHEGAEPASKTRHKAHDVDGVDSLARDGFDNLMNRSSRDDADVCRGCV